MASNMRRHVCARSKVSSKVDLRRAGIELNLLLYFCTYVSVVNLQDVLDLPIVPLLSERKGTDPHWKHLRCTHFAS